MKHTNRQRRKFWKRASRVEKEERETGEKIAGYCVKIEEKKKIKDEMVESGCKREEGRCDS